MFKVISNSRALVNIQIQQLRLGHHIRGKPPTIARSLKERLDELNRKDELYAKRIDIGLPRQKKGREDILARSVEVRKIKKDPALEQLARNNKLQANINQVREDWLETIGPQQKKQIADHYGIYEHLFHEGYFIPYINLDIFYEIDAETALPVYTGNLIKPHEAKSAPDVYYKAEKDSLWSLVLTSLDGHLFEENKEYLHWFVANIPENDISKGDIIVDYLQPIPPKGTGYHRYVYILYKQDGLINYNLDKVSSDSPLDARTFVTREWYAKNQDNITPAGLAFFQSDWDPSLKDFYHNTLHMKEPVYEYDFPSPYIKPQTWFPLREPFNLYMDKYRDPKQINKEYLVRKLKDVHPFKAPEPPLKFPNAIPYPKKMPSWLKLHEKKYRLGWGRVNEMK